MSNFYNDSVIRTARKDHKCTYCAEKIVKGETYTYQKGNYEGSWFESKMHHECFEDMAESFDDSYIPYSNERPVIKAPDQSSF